MIGSGRRHLRPDGSPALTIAREMDVRYELLIPAQAEAMLLVEQQGDDPHEVGERLREIVMRKPQAATGVRCAGDDRARTNATSIGGCLAASCRRCTA